MRIRVISPVTMRRTTDLMMHSIDERRDVVVEKVTVQTGPATIESEFDEALAAPDTIARICEAERDGCDAVVVSCFADPGVKGAREVVDIPVLGPGESSMHLATILGECFSVLTVLESAVPAVRNHARLFGVMDRLASVRSVEIPVLELHQDAAKITAALIEEGVQAVRQDGAHVLVLGCTGMTGLAQEVEMGLARHGIENVPVLDPLECAIKLAEALVNLGVTHSKRTYPYPPAKEIIGYDNVQHARQSERAPV